MNYQNEKNPLFIVCNITLIFLKKSVRVFSFLTIFVSIMKNFEVKLQKIKYEYKFIKTLDVGIVLKGNEVKSIKSREFYFIDSFCFFKNGELFVKNFIINNSENPKRDKKLLLHRNELNKFEKELIKGLTIVLYKVFTNDKGIIKCTIVLVRKNKNYEKRQNIKEKDLQRENKFGYL